MPALPSPDAAPFEQDIKNRHLIYDYDVPGAQTDSGKDEKWRYEMWFHSEDRIVYAIHGGPMAGRYNYQTAYYQCVRPGEIWQCNWLEETGTICSLVYDIPNRKVTTLLGFSKGHWTQAEAAHGDKRNKEDFERWRQLAKVGIQTERHMLAEQASIVEDFHGAGELKDIDVSWPTI
ncbi:Calycin-like protein [Microdochium trichocladiopsis]|uniref:Calycin-like protein n=1 Tax=Microdochium trichocladiopsis TaxID=1682393 RepID=A0A9P9BZ75_9PEZI|nr:Calycin-like protein [Microdochium trichocladiopsis]KAH7039809.1 Calycin-like protein [Microdochium trichocladiopsis]